MNIKTISNSFKNINFQNNDNQKKTINQTMPYSQLGKIATMAILLSATSCNNKDIFIKDKAFGNDIEYHLHKPDNIRLTPEERKLEQIAQKIAGDYYEVEYLPKIQMLKLTAGDICENEYVPEEEVYTFTMSNLKRGFALPNRVILKNNPSLYSVKDQSAIYKTEAKNLVAVAAIQGRVFYSPALNPENDFDEAILLPGQSLYIPVKEIGQRLRYGQLPFKFSIFKDAIKKSNK